MKNRKVKIVHKHDGTVAKGKTNSKGKFEIPVTGGAGGKYYGKVKKTKLKGGDVCRSAKSKTIKL